MSKMKNDSVGIETASRADVPNDADHSETTKSWQVFDDDIYREEIDRLVHFSVKTVNSNVAAGGVRLGAGRGLNLPYISARTLLHHGNSLDLDYVANSGKTATVIKQVYAVIKNEAFASAALPQEREAIISAMREVAFKEFSTGIQFVDARLRQLLIPRGEEWSDYVAITPLTASGLCHLLCDSKGGIVSQHNIQAKEEKDTFADTKKRKSKRITQARFGIGGANPQNVGRLVRGMQMPILADSPTHILSMRTALALYYRGVSFNWQIRGSSGVGLKVAFEILSKYAEFLSDQFRSGSILSTMTAREKESKLLHQFTDEILLLGEGALDILRAYRNSLPHENRLVDARNGEFELISRKVPGTMRGLIDPALRGLDYRRSERGIEIDWPRETANWLASEIAAIRLNRNGENVPLIPLDESGRRSIAAIIEDYLR